MPTFPISVTRARHALVSLALVAGTMAAVAAPQGASAVDPDQLVVVDVDGTTSNLSPVSLKTVNVDGSKSFAKPVNLPATGDGAFTLAGSSNGNGALARSSDGNSLVIGGYNHAEGVTGQTDTTYGADCSIQKTTTPTKPKDTLTTTLATEPACVATKTFTWGPAVQRSVARISSNATVDTSTVLGTALNKAHPRGVATDTGSSFYVSGNNAAADTGVFSVALGGGTRTGIAGQVNGAGADQKNTRGVQIAGGDLYTVSEKTTLAGLGKIGSGLPSSKSAITRLGAAISTADLPVPTGMVLLNASDAIAGIDTAYVALDSNDDDINDEIRKYTSDGSTWSANGTKSTAAFTFLTGRVSGGTVELFATTSSGDKLVKFNDTGAAGAASFGPESTVATAAAGHAFRGLAFAPTSWDPGTVATDAPTASVANSKVGGTLGDANNPGTTLTLADTDTDPADLTVEAHSSNTTVIPDSAIEVTGSGLERAVSFTPSAVGRAEITFTVTDDHDGVGTAKVTYGASAAPASASGRYLYDSSDLSSAVDVGDGYAIAVSSEDNKVRLYKKSESNRPVKEFDFEGDIGGTNADLESMARANDTLYVLGSHGNSSSDGSLKPARDVMFTAAIAGSGADTTLTFVSKRNGLREVIKAWDVSHGSTLGFTAGQADGKKANDPDGFNIEGFELAPGSTTTGYLAFRAPIKSGKAILVPITNLSPLLTGTPEFGEPVFLDLGGRTIREIRKNSDDEYLISAQAGSASPEWKLFAWDGNPNHKAVGVKDLPNPDQNRTGAWESIVSVPHPLTAGGSTTLITDSGDTTYYGDATPGADESKGLRKSYIDEFTTSSFTDYPDAFVAPDDLSSPSKTSTSVSLAWTKVPDATSYILGKTKSGGVRSTKNVGDVSTGKFSGLSPSSEYTFDITAVKAGNIESAPSAPLTVTTAAAPTDRPTNVHMTSRTATGLTIAWTKKPGATKYKVNYVLSTGGTAKTLTVGDVDTASITGLTRGKAYNVKVLAIESNATESPYSTPILTVSTSNLLPPTNFAKKSNQYTNRISVKWTKAVGAEGYRIFYGIGSGPRTKVEVSGGTTESKTITGLQPNTTYTFDIASLEDGGTSRSDYTTPRISIKTQP